MKIKEWLCLGVIPFIQFGPIDDILATNIKWKKTKKTIQHEKTIFVQAHMLILKLVLLIHVNIIHFQLFNSSTLIPRIELCD
jgi:hypothetical protein